MKRATDLLLAVIAILLLLPIALVVAISVRWKMGAPIFFQQTRPGLRARPFVIFKFRTMLNVVDENGTPLSDANRLTNFGSFLRSTSLDELPSLWNVLKGDMSFVGPRPLLMEYLALYSSDQARRMEVRPGITGWAQINGRNAISWNERLALDVWYVDNRTLWLDLKILGLTLVKVVRRKDICADGEATMPKFKGSGR